MPIIFLWVFSVIIGYFFPNSITTNIEPKRFWLLSCTFRFGRRLTSLIAASVAAVLFTATAFSPTYLCYVLLLFIDGSLWTILYNTNFTWGKYEYKKEKKKLNDLKKISSK